MQGISVKWFKISALFKIVWQNFSEQGYTISKGTRDDGKNLLLGSFFHEIPRLPVYFKMEPYIFFIHRLVSFFILCTKL